MAKLSVAEKQRRYRERRDADPTKRQAYLEKERSAWRQKRASGKVKSIGEVSERTQRKVRKQWREAQRRCRQKESNQSTTKLTPPSTPDAELPSSSSRYRLRVKYKSLYLY